MMDKNEHSFLTHIPMRSLSLRLARSTIKMTHGFDWKVDKVNPAHDLVICLSGSGTYQFDDEDQPILLEPGDAMLIPKHTRFRGAHGGSSEIFTGIAQHFFLELFGRGDVLSQLKLSRKVSLPDWTYLEPLAQHYRQTVPHGAMTLAQHHQFMVLLLSYLDAAFGGWTTAGAPQGSQDHLSVQIMLAASRLSSDPLGGAAEEALADVPYNPDYFRRAFKERLGYTPQKYRELKRMEFAADRLGMGYSVKAVAAELGYSDPYFFSRMFKRYLGASPMTYRVKPKSMESLPTKRGQLTRQ